MDQELLSMPQVAELLRVGYYRVLRACLSGKVVPLRAGRARLFRPEDIADLRRVLGPGRRSPAKAAAR